MILFFMSCQSNIFPENVFHDSVELSPNESVYYWFLRGEKSTGKGLLVWIGDGIGFSSEIGLLKGIGNI